MHHLTIVARSARPPVAPRTRLEFAAATGVNQRQLPPSNLCSIMTILDQLLAVTSTPFAKLNCALGKFDSPCSHNSLLICKIVPCELCQGPAALGDQLCVFVPMMTDRHCPRDFFDATVCSYRYLIARAFHRQATEHCNQVSEQKRNLVLASKWRCKISLRLHR